MCVRLTCVHSETSGHVFVFVWVRVCTPVLVRALPAVCRRLSLSLSVSGPLSQCVRLLVQACPQDCLWGGVCVWVYLCPWSVVCP